MALFDGIKRQLRSVIEWDNTDPDALFQQWTDNGDEIKNASTLIVGPGQGCIFVYRGKVHSVIQEPCSVNLKTENIPFWTTISRFMQFFESEYKVGIYFFKRSTILDQKWGTTSIIKYQDPIYQFPVGLKAFGNYSYRIVDPHKFFTTIVGSRQDFFIDDFRPVMSARIVQPLSDLLATCGYGYTEIDVHRDDLSSDLLKSLQGAFAKLGLELSDFRIEGTDFDDDTQARIKRIADLTAEAHAAKAAGIGYAELQQLEALREAAKNEGGGAGMGVGLGAGIGLGQNLANRFTSNNGQPGDVMDKLAKLKQLLDSGLITEQDYAEKKQQLLSDL